jgi:molybdate transport system substrate-binding protein
MEAGVAKLKVMCARSMHRAVGAITREFSRSTGHEVALEFDTVGALHMKIAAGESADVMILADSAIDKLEHSGKLVAGSRTNVARTYVAMCVREGAPMPDIATPQAFERTLRDARAIALSDPAAGGSAAVYLKGLFRRMGLSDVIAAKGLQQPSGVEVARRVVEGKADFGLTLSGEIASVPGAVIAGPLPPPLGNDTIYVAGVSAGCTERAAAETFIAALIAPAMRAVWERAGFALPAGA